MIKRRNAPHILILALIAVAGCGNSDPTGPRTDAAANDAGAQPEAASDSPTDSPPSSRLVLELPATPPIGVPFPIVVRTRDAAPLSARVSVTVGASSPRGVDLWRGRGSLSVTIDGPGDVAIVATLEDEKVMRTVTAVARPLRTLGGTLSGDDLRWGAERDVVLSRTAEIPAGATLIIEAGARIFAAVGANLDIVGALEAKGTSERPIVFTRQAAAPWGGISFAPGSKGSLDRVFLTAGGGDGTRVFGHSTSQPVLFARQADVLVHGGGAIDNPGKAYSSELAKLTLRDVLVSRCDQGGEHAASELLVERSHFLELPDGDGKADDDDNDGIYLSSGSPPAGTTPRSIIRDSVFAVGEDDGIDHNGATVDLERVWIERMTHEGVAGSNGGRITVTDSVISRCQQGVEAGYGSPEVVVKHTLIIDAGIGLRWGDEYPTESRGTLTARYVVVARSREANVRNFWAGGGMSRPEAIDIACSMVGAPDWDGKAGNAPGVPTFDKNGCIDETLRMLPGCPDGPIGPHVCP